jgi:hypothetical protein
MMTWVVLLWAYLIRRDQWVETFVFYESVLGQCLMPSYRKHRLKFWSDVVATFMLWIGSHILV